MRRRRLIILASLGGAWLLAGGQAMSWSSYGGDPGGTRYARLAQIVLALALPDAVARAAP